jgi:four helix bundle protein
MKKRKDMQHDIQERAFNFGLRIINLSNSLPNSQSGRVIGKQVLRSCTSIGANVEEADAAYSRDDFNYKISIALQEARETHYWLRLIRASALIKPKLLESIITEAEELKKILGSIASKTRGTAKKKH